MRGVRQVRERLFRLAPDRGSLWVGAALVVAAGSIMLLASPTLERLAGTRTFDALYFFLLAGVLSVTGWGVYRLVAVWLGLKRALDAVAGTPLITAFERVPQRIARMGRITFFAVQRSAAVVPVISMQWSHLKTIGARLVPEPAPPPRVAVPFIADEGSTIFPASPGAAPPSAPGRTALETAVAQVAVATEPTDVVAGRLRVRIAAYMAGDAPNPRIGIGPSDDESHRGRNFLELAAILEEFWAAEPARDTVQELARHFKDRAGEREDGPSTSGRFRRSFPDDLRLWLRAAEEFAAVQVADYAQWVIGRLRLLALFLFVRRFYPRCCSAFIPTSRRAW